MKKKKNISKLNCYRTKQGLEVWKVTTMFKRVGATQGWRMESLKKKKNLEGFLVDSIRNYGQNLHFEEKNRGLHTLHKPWKNPLSDSSQSPHGFSETLDGLVKATSCQLALLLFFLHLWQDLSNDLYQLFAYLGASFLNS